MPSTAIRPISHEDRLSVVEHLDELRKRLIICVVGLIVIFSLCFWQNKAILDLIGRPLATQTEQRTAAGKGPLGGIYDAQRGARDIAGIVGSTGKVLGRDPGLGAASRAALARQTAAIRKVLSQLPSKPPPNKPVTLGIGEPFTQTFAVAGYAALLIGMPLILYQLYAFLLPAFSPRERRVAVPFMAMIPVLFITGVVFAYLVVLPPATKFLQNFNSDQFNVLVQARDYFKFAVITMAAVGLVFQLPVALLAIIWLGVVTTAQLRGLRRYAIVATAVLAALLPGVDPVSLIIEFVILYALFEISLVVAFFMDRASSKDPLTPSTGGGLAARFGWDDEDEDDEDEDDLDDERANDDALAGFLPDDDDELLLDDELEEQDHGASDEDDDYPQR